MKKTKKTATLAKKKPATAKVVLRKTEDGKFVFVVLSKNSKVIVNSEAYGTKASAKAGIKALQEAMKKATIIDESK